MSLLNRIAALVSISSLFAAPAFAHGNNGAPGPVVVVTAQHNGYGWSPARYVRPLSFAFEDLDARINRKGDLVVRYQVQPQSLRAAENAGITPVLQIAVGKQLLQSRIDEKNGVVVFRLGRRMDPKKVVISVTGANGRYRIDTVALRGLTATRIAVQVDDFDRGRDRDRGHRGHHDRDHRGHDDRGKRS